MPDAISPLAASPVVCAFCGATPKDARLIFAGDHAHICDACAIVCKSVLAGQTEYLDARGPTPRLITTTQTRRSRGGR